MASIHIAEIRNILRAREKDADEFIEIKFNNEQRKPSKFVDAEFANRVITADCPYGSVTITFDAEGLLKSLDIC